MKKLLYIGHDYHNKTRSTQFLQDILKTEYKVEIFDYDPHKNTNEIFKKLKGQMYEMLIFFQIMPSIKLLKEYITFEKAVLFPMYDGVPSRKDTVWLEYKNFNIINFSRTLHEELLEIGLSSYYIQYFPKPIAFSNWGDEKSIFFWQRTDVISINLIEKLFDLSVIKHIHLHKTIDPGHSFTEPAPKWLDKISFSTWYEKKEDMLQDLEKAAIYIAPRDYEGIGMSFLEAMSMGRCVIAPNNPTMNEYIENGKTGFLYNLEEAKQIDIKNISEIQMNTLKYMKKGYENWEKEKYKILEWLIAPVKNNQLALNKNFQPSRKYLKKLFFRIQQENNRTKYYFCRVPAFEIKSSPSMRRVYLLGIIPVLKTEKQGKKIKITFLKIIKFYYK